LYKDNNFCGYFIGLFFIASIKNLNEIHKTKTMAEKEKTNSKFRKFTKYLRELSVVVVGVAITFIGSTWINNYQEKNKLERHLDTVKIELEHNLAIVQGHKEYYEDLAKLSEYLRSDKPENLQQDSINPYIYVIGNFFTVVYGTGALETLKTSGTMNRIKNQNLSKSILDSYAALEGLKGASDSYMSRKMDEVYNGILNNQQIFDGDIRHPNIRRMFLFFALSMDIETEMTAIVKQLEETLLLLENR